VRGMAELVSTPLNRKIDRIDTGPRFSEADAIRLNRLFRAPIRSKCSPVCCMTGGGRRRRGIELRRGKCGAAASGFPGRSGDPVLFLEPQAFSRNAGLPRPAGGAAEADQVDQPDTDAAALAAKDESGLRWSYHPDGCCEIRKVAPLATRCLASMHRSPGARLPVRHTRRAAALEIDTRRAGPAEDQPVADGAQRPRRYVAEHELPPHPLVAEAILDRLLACTTKSRRRNPRGLEGLGQDECRHPCAGLPDDKWRAAAGYDPVF